uniref:Uncharacterized protein n=1 Tax=Anopheles epiroticus TaxID=199890 RepID=A0A182P1I1_9DIPT
MPFISKDWRSPGDSWVKTDEGWEKLKVLECVKRKRAHSSRRKKREIVPVSRTRMSQRRAKSVFASPGEHQQRQSQLQK